MDVIFTNSFDTLPTTVKTTVKLNSIKKKREASVGMKIKSAVDVRLRSEKEEENGWLREENRLYLLRIRKVDKQGLRDP
jgi:hypothetical protein